MYKPFIQLFKTPNRKYFFEPNKNEFVIVSDESYNFLWNLLNTSLDISNLSIPKEIEELINRGYLAKRSAVKKVIHPYTEHVPIMLERKLSKLTLQVTQNCNFRCKYCIYSEVSNPSQRSHSNKHMDWKTAKKAIDFLSAHSSDSKKLYIGFYGGEPLLEFKLIQQAVEYCEEKFIGKNIEFSITSNGTLLNEEMIKYFSNHEIQLMISIDGPKEINDQNRIFKDGRGTYDKVIEKLELIKKIAPEYAHKVRFSMVINPENDFDCINSITINTNVIDKWNILAAYVDKDYEENNALFFSNQYIYQYRYHEFLSLLAYFNRIDVEKVSPISYLGISRIIEDSNRMDMASGLSAQCAPGGPCIPGQIRLFSDVNGNLFPCERVSECSEAMCIGNISTGFNYKKVVDLLNIGALTEEACKNCWSFMYCTMCAKAADIGQNTLSAQKKLTACQSTRESAYIQLYNILLVKEIFELYDRQIRTDNELH